MGASAASRGQQAELVIAPELPVPNPLRNMKQKKLQQVTLAEFNVPQLRQAAMEGRLFMEPLTLSAEQLHQQALTDVLSYVSHIDHCATPQCRPYISRIWHTLVHHPVLGQLFFYTRYAGKKGKPNLYRINAVAFLLHEKGYYSSQYNHLQLHCLLEASSKATNIYAGTSKYWPNRQEQKLILACCKEVMNEV